MVSYAIRRRGLPTDMNTIYCKGSHSKVKPPEWEKVEETAKRLHARADRYRFAGLEMLALDKLVGGEELEGEDKARLRRLHNQYGHETV